MSQSKISRIESGKVLPTVVDVDRIIQALEIPSEVARDLLSLARAANIDYASVRSSARAGLWRRQLELKALVESSATVRYFLPVIPSGLLQTAEYARATLTPTVAGQPARDVERAVAARLKRQEALRDESRRFCFLLTEQAVRWQYVEPQAMAAQLRHMIDISRLPNVELAVIPLDTLIDDAPLNIFVVYGDRLVLVELFSGEIALRDPQDVTYHLNLFEHFWKYALKGDDARDFMRDRD
jgi:transcriptional regulator with XRE-family HTH domain